MTSTGLENLTELLQTKTNFAGLLGTFKWREGLWRLGWVCTHTDGQSSGPHFFRTGGGMSGKLLVSLLFSSLSHRTHFWVSPSGGILFFLSACHLKRTHTHTQETTKMPPSAGAQISAGLSFSSSLFIPPLFSWAEIWAKLSHWLRSLVMWPGGFQKLWMCACTQAGFSPVVFFPTFSYWAFCRFYYKYYLKNYRSASNNWFDVCKSFRNLWLFELIMINLYVLSIK